jgi:hypothetical protein
MTIAEIIALDDETLASTWGGRNVDFTRRILRHIADAWDSKQKLEAEKIINEGIALNAAMREKA